MAEACLGAKCEMKSGERQGLSSALGLRRSNLRDTSSRPILSQIGFLLGIIICSSFLQCAQP